MIKLRDERTEERIRTGKVFKMTPEEREVKKQEALKERFKYESTRMRGYELIYPCSDKVKLERYEKLLQISNTIFDDFTTGKGVK